jgi:hypothetical protein
MPMLVEEVVLSLQLNLNVHVTKQNRKYIIVLNPLMNSAETVGEFYCTLQVCMRFSVFPPTTQSLLEDV